MSYRFFVVVFMLFVFVVGCEDTVLPKPKAMLRLEYPRPMAKVLETDYYQIEYNRFANYKNQNSKSLVLEYPDMNAAIFISYKKVEDNLEKLITDAERLSYEHGVKADDIRARIYENNQSRVYGTFFEVIGNAASQAQFYVTDSTEHFVTGSLYFTARPNYDSIYPAAKYLQNDIGHIMESLRWK